MWTNIYNVEQFANYYDKYVWLVNIWKRICMKKYAEYMWCDVELQNGIGIMTFMKFEYTS